MHSKSLMPAVMLGLLSLAGPSFAQQTTASPTSGQALPQISLSIPAISEWLKSQGLGVGPVREADGQPYLQVRDGQVSWTLAFNSCTGQVCGDVQFSAGFNNAGVTLESVNAWNAERRFVKAYYAPPSSSLPNPSAVLQYDALIPPGDDPAALTDAVAIWRGLLPAFAVHVGYLQPVMSGAAEQD